MVSKTNLPVSEKLQWQRYIEQSQKAASEAQQQEFQLKREEMQLKHAIEMEKIKAQIQIAARKAEDQREKDIMKTAVDQEKLRIQEARDAQTAQLKYMQIMVQAQLGSQKEKREWTDMLINADLNKKRLMLDVAEVVAMSRNSQTAEGIKAYIEMYKAALNAGTATKQQEVEYATKIMDGLIKLKVETQKAGIDAGKLQVEAQKGMLDTASKVQEIKGKLAGDKMKAASDIAKENIKAQSAEKVAAEQGKATVEAAKHQATAAKEAAKSAAKTEKKPSKPL
jgi:hypothetical protein